MNEFEQIDLAPPPEGLDFRSELLRRAAEAGPGYRGRRESLLPNQAEALAQEISEAGEVVPPYLERPARWIDRHAKLFEAGEYPDKGVTISETDLRNLADGFELPVPVLIEHAGSPLELGYLTRVEVDGGELFGTVALTEEADALIQRSGAKSLSLGLTKDLSAIREVSLVRKPRVRDARLFGEVCFWTELEERDWTNGTDGTDEFGESHSTHESPSSHASVATVPAANWRARYEELAAKVEGEEASRKVEELIREGKLLPAQADYARALLQTSGTIDFDGESRPVH